MLPDRESSNFWGWFGYEGAMIDRAIHADNLPNLKECVRLGFVSSDCEVIGARSVVDQCDKKKAVKCAAWLRSEGWR